MEIGDAGRSVGRYTGVDLREVGDWQNGEIIGEATSPLRDHLRGPGGGIRTGALLTMCDNIGGFCAGLAALPDGWVVSTNLTASSVGSPDARSLRSARCFSAARCCARVARPS